MEAMDVMDSPATIPAQIIPTPSSNGDVRNGEKKHKKHKHHKNGKDRDRDRERDHKKHGSSSEHKSDGSKSGHHKSKHKDKHREKDRSEKSEKSGDRDKDKEKSSRDKSDSSKIKTESRDSSSSPSKSASASPVKASSPAKVVVAKEEPKSDSDDDMPLSQRRPTTSPVKPVKKEESDSDDDLPLSKRKSSNSAKKPRRSSTSSDDLPLSQRRKRPRSATPQKPSKKSKSSTSSKSSSSSPTKRVKKEEEKEEVWEWWKEERRSDGSFKWRTLEHKGPVFAPPYEPLPKSVKFKYNGNVMKLSLEAEEVAGFYSRFIEHDYTTKEKFNENFFKDWRKVMTREEREIITDLKKCDFRDINEYYKAKAEERKAMSKEEKLKIKQEKDEIQKEYGVCTIDGHKEKIGNFNIEPPGLFRGRGEHPKMGMLKKRVQPEDVIINCSKNSKFPVPPPGHRWKEIRHDNEVSWLANWTENVQGQGKYVMLNPTSRLKGEKDWLKYEKARELSKHIDKIRSSYRDEWHSKEMRVRQRAVAMYFIDKLALRAGNEKDGEEQADTVGCCSLRFEHITLDEQKDGKSNVVTFDFLGKDSIRYFNEVEVEKRVFKNLKLFMEHKKPGDDLFDRLNVSFVKNYFLNRSIMAEIVEVGKISAD